MLFLQFNKTPYLGVHQTGSRPINADDVTRRFGIEPASLKEMQSANRVISFVSAENGPRFPASQFFEAGVVPALDELIAIIGTQGETWRWLLQNCAEFGEIPPLDLLKQGRVESVISEAHMQYDVDSGW